MVYNDDDDDEIKLEEYRIQLSEFFLDGNGNNIYPQRNTDGLYNVTPTVLCFQRFIRWYNTEATQLIVRQIAREIRTSEDKMIKIETESVWVNEAIKIEFARHLYPTFNRL